MTAHPWDPTQYQRFGGPRKRPALELLSRTDHAGPALVHDVGCGIGQMTRLMASKWPDARVVGSDVSAEMLREARQRGGPVEFVRSDVRTWDPPEPPDVIYSNAVLHWVPDHDELILRLYRSLNEGGVLAFQMPLSWHEPSHLLIRRTLAAEALGPDELLASLERPNVAEPGHYFELLVDEARAVDLWVTRYYHRLSGPDAVLEWVKGTALRPVVEGLEPHEWERFVDVYGSRLREAYPETRPGTTVYPFPRLFLVAQS